MSKYGLEDQPQDLDGDGTAKTAIARIQRDHLHEAKACFCARCRLSTPLGLAYKCRFCAVWYCHGCALIHFTSPALAAEKQQAIEEAADMPTHLRR